MWHRFQAWRSSREFETFSLRMLFGMATASILSISFMHYQLHLGTFGARFVTRTSTNPAEPVL
jgi:hypothetical protein|tara:strand:+ start:201 stop:389 length:189 start_codon:yes stop_codon:yes gene_type:complete